MRVFGTINNTVMSTSLLFMCALLSFLHRTSAQELNSVPTPIIKDSAFVHTREFAKIPDESGAGAKIVCIIPFSRSLFICTLSKIYLVKPSGTPTLFLDVANAINSATDRKLDVTNRIHGGVRSIAFHPSFWNTGLFYITAMETRPTDPRKFHYISDVPDPIDADSVLLEFRYDLHKREVDTSSYRSVFRVGMPVFDHTIRQIAFRGKDLYIAHGDGSEQDATVGGGQNGDARGKILRINPTLPTTGSRPYSIPNSNPFIGDSKMPDEVYATGFRNPHHICFGNDGTLYVADTGRSNIEEINLVKAGQNYGWSKREGTFIHAGSGLLEGIAELPDDDEKYGYTYPNAQLGHAGKRGASFKGTAVAGACPVENRSPMSGMYWYGDFPKTGRLFFSKISELKRAVTKGKPSDLTQARTHEAVVCLEEGGSVKRVRTLGGVIREDPKYKDSDRVDIRFGRGPNGELYWSSKTNGKLYVLTSSQEGGPDSSC